MKLNDSGGGRPGEAANVKGHRVNRSIIRTGRNVAALKSGVVVSALALALAAGMATAMQQPAGEGARTEAPSVTGVRRQVTGGPTVLAFKQFTVEQIVPFLVESTGKVVMPMQDVMTRKVTVINDKPIPREQALDLVYMALLQNGVAVIETETTITLRDVADITKGDILVIPPDESVLARTDLGVIAEKVFRLRSNTAKAMGEVIKDKVPDYAKLSVDEESNQLALIGNVAFLQRMERLISSLDRPAAGALTTETFRLRFADAEVIKANIEELYGGGGATAAAGSASNSRRRGGQVRGQQQQQPMFRFPGQGGGEQPAAAASEELRVTANTQQNAVTVVADEAVLQQIKYQLDEFWDKPLPPEAVVPKVYDLRHTDPVKIANILDGLFAKAGTSRSTQTGGGGGGGQFGGGGGGAAASSGTSQGVARLAGQFSFQPVPDAGRLIVVAKSPDSITAIDRIIEELDQPQTVGLPAVVELKHANAEDLAEQLNALLAADGTLAQVRRAESGLATADTATSPFASNATTDAGQVQQDAATSAANLSFWWQRSRTTNETTKRNASNLIGNIRIVPVWRQNALLVVAPPEYRQSIIEMVDSLDRPGRQVLISAILASVSIDDATALGLRWSSQTITPTRGDNSVSLTNGFQGSNTSFADSLFDSSVLQSNLNLNVMLQALAEKTAVSVLSEPKIFTSDNQEATFFDGQDIPFVSDSQLTDQGTRNQTFDYKAVGIALRARPRITVNGDVDLRVNVELSSIAPGQTIDDSLIVNRRETTTQLIIKDRQTVVISGLLRQEDSDIVRKVPLLGDIPVLGLLFKSKERTKTNSELLIFITPIVVNNTGENDALNVPYRERLDRLKSDLAPADGRSDEPAPSAAPTAAPAAEKTP